MALFQAMVVTLLCFLGHSVDGHSDLIKWVDHNQVTLLDLEPAGARTNNMTMFVARMVYQITLDGNLATGLFPGFWMYQNNVFLPSMHCIINGQDRNSKDFEVLIFPRGLVSWIPGERVLPTDEKVVGGIDPITNEVLYLCRLMHKRSTGEPLISPGKLTASGDCSVAYYGEVTSKANYEVLVVNAYGKFPDV